MPSIELDTEAIRHAKPDVRLSAQQASALDRKVARSREAIAGSRLLWVDDNPSNNSAERRYLRSADVIVVNATTTDQALAELTRFDFDVVVTDRTRGDDHLAGRHLAGAMRDAGFQQPVIAYIGHYDRSESTPSEFFGMTDRPDKLVSLYLDAVDCARGRVR